MVKWIPSFIGMAGGDSPRCLAGLNGCELL